MTNIQNVQAKMTVGGEKQNRKSYTKKANIFKSNAKMINAQFALCSNSSLAAKLYRTQN